MTENKRFKRLCSSIDYYYCIDKRNNDKGLTEADMLNMLNDLSNENEELKQFKENVINWVDSQMKFNSKKYIETKDDHFKNENIDLHNFKVIIGIDSDD